MLTSIRTGLPTHITRIRITKLKKKKQDTREFKRMSKYYNEENVKCVGCKVIRRVQYRKTYSHIQILLV